MPRLDRPHAHEGRRTHVRRSPIRHAAKSLHEQTIVLIVERLTGKIGSPAPSLAQHTRSAAECVDDQSGIVGKCRQSTAFVKVFRFGERVLLERVEHLERIFVSRLRDARSGEVNHVDAERRAQRDQLANLARAPRGDEQPPSIQLSSARC